MKKIIYLTFICISIMSFGVINSNPLSTETVVHAERQTPPYAKWGKIAVEKTKEKYPDAKVVDYLHVGQEDKGNHSIEKFKLWLKGSDKEYGVLVHIEFNKSTEQIINMTFEEVAR